MKRHVGAASSELREQEDELGRVDRVRHGVESSARDAHFVRLVRRSLARQVEADALCRRTARQEVGFQVAVGKSL